MPLPPGPRLPRAVQTLGWLLRPMPFMERCRQRYGDVFTMRIANEGTWIFLAHPDAVREVFTGDPRLLHAGEANQVLRPLLGLSSVLLLDDDAHLRQRRLLLPPLHGERMQRYGALMGEIAEREVASWPPGEPLALRPRMQAMTLEVILRAIYGAEGAGLERLRAELRRTLELTTRRRSFALAALLGPQRWERVPAYRAALARVDAAVLEEVRRRREATDVAGRDDILSLLLQARHEDGAPMSDGELRDELVTLLVAGHETTATALSWAMERLLRHPAALERVRAGDEAYIDAVVRETLRLRPVLPIVSRRLTEPMEIAGWPLPAGVSVTPCIHLIHRRDDVYPEPRRFRPERFLEEPPGTYTWIPFGGGIRRCLGAAFALYEMRVVLPVVARAVTLDGRRPQAERVRRRAVTLVPEHGAEAVRQPV